ncbi:MAG: aspartate kinase [Deltaproteobacteria bacterium]|nr:aspartate kinase [Deltaproteobacteria bacterium]
MPVIVQKYGGSSVSEPEKIKRVAEKIVATMRGGRDVVVVVSAMGHTTDELLRMAKEIDPSPARRELDMLMSVGERVSMSLLTMAIQKLGCEAISLTGSQSGIITNDSHTNARIIEVRPYRIQDEIERGRIVIVAGFQGVSYKKEITTLGRGGSDTTAVALAAALGAEYAEIFSDVDGVFSADPNAVPEARKIERLSYQEMQEMAEAGAKVLNAQAVEFAKQKGIVIYAKSTFSDGAGTHIGRTVTDRTGQVIGVAYESELVHLQAAGLAPEPMSELLRFLDGAQIVGKQLRVEQVDGSMELSLVVSLQNIHDFAASKEALQKRFGPAVSITEDLGAVSLIGDGINADNGNVRRLLDVLGKAGIQPRSVSTSSFRITTLVPEHAVRPLVAACHREFISGADRGNAT